MKKIVPPALTGTKDAAGAFVKESPGPSAPTIDLTGPDVAIDTLLKRALGTIERIMKACSQEASTGAPSRESVQNLKDCVAMLHTLKEKEDEILDEMSDEELISVTKGEK